MKEVGREVAVEAILLPAQGEGSTLSHDHIEVGRV